MAFVHASYPKELQPTAALHVATTGIIAGCHGLSHRARALIGIALCNRWGGDIPEQEVEHKKLLEDVVLRDGNKVERERIVWWTQYIGTIMYVICGVHPGGNIRDGLFNFNIEQKVNSDKDLQSLALEEKTPANASKRREFEVMVRISKDDLKTSASVRACLLYTSRCV